MCRWGVPLPQLPRAHRLVWPHRLERRRLAVAAAEVAVVPAVHHPPPRQLVALEGLTSATWKHGSTTCASDGCRAISVGSGPRAAQCEPPATAWCTAVAYRGLVLLSAAHTSITIVCGQPGFSAVASVAESQGKLNREVGSSLQYSLIVDLSRCAAAVPSLAMNTHAALAKRSQFVCEYECVRVRQSSKAAAAVGDVVLPSTHTHWHAHVALRCPPVTRHLHVLYRNAGELSMRGKRAVLATMPCCVVLCSAARFCSSPHPAPHDVTVCVFVCVCVHTHRHAYMHAIVHTHPPSATVAVLQSYEAEGVGQVSTYPKLER